jgi:hypothetical protein
MESRQTRANIRLLSKRLSLSQCVKRKFELVVESRRLVRHPSITMQLRHSALARCPQMGTIQERDRPVPLAYYARGRSIRPRPEKFELRHYLRSDRLMYCVSPPRHLLRLWGRSESSDSRSAMRRELIFLLAVPGAITGTEELRGVDHASAYVWRLQIPMRPVACRGSVRGSSRHWHKSRIAAS